LDTLFCGLILLLIMLPPSFIYSTNIYFCTYYVQRTIGKIDMYDIFLARYLLNYQSEPMIGLSHDWRSFSSDWLDLIRMNESEANYFLDELTVRSPLCEGKFMYFFAMFIWPMRICPFIKLSLLVPAGNCLAFFWAGMVCYLYFYYVCYFNSYY
jgi:hypothetical protein